MPCLKNVEEIFTAVVKKIEADHVQKFNGECKKFNVIK